jgi:hypothetical protein
MAPHAMHDLGPPLAIDARWSARRCARGIRSAEVLVAWAQQVDHAIARYR